MWAELEEIRLGPWKVGEPSGSKNRMKKACRYLLIRPHTLEKLEKQPLSADEKALEEQNALNLEDFPGVTL